MTVRLGLYNGLCMNPHSDRGVTLVLGAPNSGKRGFVLDWWQERLADRPVIVMPTAPDARGMTTEMAQREGGLVGQSPALTFAGLAETVLGRRCDYTDGLHQRVMLSRLLRRVSLERLQQLAHLPGVPVALGRLFLELGDSGRSVGQIQALLRQWASADPKSAAVATDVAELLSEYEQSVGSLGMIDRPAAVREAAAESGDWDRPVAFCGFTSFTRGQRQLMEALGAVAPIVVTLNYERERGAGLSTPGEFEWWSGRAVDFVDMSPPALAYRAQGIAWLERSMLDLESKKEEAFPEVAAADGVRFLLASGRRAEAELAAQQVAELLRSGIAAGDIAVVVRKVRTWSRLLRDVFGSCGIPCQTDERPLLVETGLGYSFLQALRSAAYDDAEALLCYLRSPYSGVAAESVSALEAGYLRGVSKGAAALVGHAGKEVQRVLGPIRALVTESSKPGDEGPPCGTVDMAVAKDLAGRMLACGARGALPGERELEDDARAFLGLGAGLDVLARLGDGTAQVEEVLGLVGQAETHGTSEVDPGAVQILSVQRARARRFEAVFVLGLVEGEFPGLPETATILSTSQKEELDSLADGLFSSVPQEEHSLFVGAATRAWSHLFLSSRDAEDDGGEAIPSRFWTEAKSLLGKAPEAHEYRTLADQVFEAAEAPSLCHYLRACAATGSEPDMTCASMVACDRVTDAGRARVAPDWRQGPARLSHPTVLAELRAMDCFSPSALESYARCPFAWFIERVVGAEELEHELDGRVEGELIHGVLRDCYRSLSEDGLLPLTSGGLLEAGRRAADLIEAVTASPECPGSVAERRLVARRLKMMAERLFSTEAAADAVLVFGRAELEVGGAEGIDIGGLRIRGRVDRLDSVPDGDGVFVLDYKSRSIPTVKAIGSAAGMQLPLYLEGIRAQETGSEVLGGAYVSLWDGVLSGVVSAGYEPLLGKRAGRYRYLEQEEWEELTAEVLELARSVVEGMRAGTIVAEARDGCPVWCALGPVCRAKVGGRSS